MNDDKFYQYTIDILANDEFQKLKLLTHHGLNRYDHSLRVARGAYEVAKRLKLNEKEVARGALLHDFFFDDNMTLGVKDRIRTLVKHPNYALDTAKEHFTLSELEEDIIVTHMFPIGIKVPKHLESWIVDIVDDIVCIYERCYGLRKQVSFASSFLLLLIFNYFR